MKATSLAVAICTLGAAFVAVPASAAVHALGNISPGDAVSFPGVTLPAKNSPITEEYTFTVVGGGSLFANSSITVAGTATTLPTGVMFALYKGTPAAPGVLIDSTSATTLPGLVFAGLGGAFGDELMTGSYFLKVTGLSKGALVLSGNLSTTAIPELQTWAMLGIGFVGVGVGMFKSRKTPRTVV